MLQFLQALATLQNIAAPALQQFVNATTIC